MERLEPETPRKHAEFEDILSSILYDFCAWAIATVLDWLSQELKTASIMAHVGTCTTSKSSIPDKSGQLSLIDTAAFLGMVMGMIACSPPHRLVF